LAIAALLKTVVRARGYDVLHVPGGRDAVDPAGLQQQAISLGYPRRTGFPAGGDFPGPSDRETFPKGLLQMIDRVVGTGSESQFPIRGK